MFCLYRKTFIQVRDFDISVLLENALLATKQQSVLGKPLVRIQVQEQARNRNEIHSFKTSCALLNVFTLVFEKSAEGG